MRKFNPLLKDGLDFVGSNLLFNPLAGSGINLRSKGARHDTQAALSFDDYTTQTVEAEETLAYHLRGIDSAWYYPGDWSIESGKVASWADHLTALLSGHSAHTATQSTAAARPTVSSVNGVAAAAVNTTQSMQIAGSLGAPTAFTVSIVFERAGNSLAAGYNAQIFGVNASSHVLLEYGLPGPEVSYHIYDGSLRDSTVVCANGLHTTTYVVNGASWNLWLDANQAGPVARTSKTMPDGPSILGDATNSYGVNGKAVSIVYCAGADATVHSLHRAWARLKCGAP